MFQNSTYGNQSTRSRIRAVIFDRRIPGGGVRAWRVIPFSDSFSPIESTAFLLHSAESIVGLVFIEVNVSCIQIPVFPSPDTILSFVEANPRTIVALGEGVLLVILLKSRISLNIEKGGGRYEIYNRPSGRCNQRSNLQESS